MFVLYPQTTNATKRNNPKPMDKSHKNNSYMETKHMSLIPIPLRREEIECKPQRPIRVPCEEIDYKTQFIQSVSVQAGTHNAHPHTHLIFQYHCSTTFSTNGDKLHQ
ncbi:hypothetical protein BGX30_004118 [Mortierella sp. GBA39]|nr:hypothetical protein BGX30_004118 [Mortierella sp. GBA39]